MRRSLFNLVFIMIETKRILEIFEKSPRIPKLPEPLCEIIALSFENKNNQKATLPVYSYIREKNERLLPILKSPLYNLPSKKYTAQELVNSVGFEALRNLLLIFWLQDLKPTGNHKQIDYGIWHRQNLLSAFYARHVAKKFLNLNPENIFIQTYLQDISLLMLSQTIPDLYSAVMQIDLRKRFQPEEEEKIMEISHGKLSELILQKWGFPKEFTRAVAQHHLNKEQKQQKQDLYRPIHILHFSQTIARFILNTEKDVKYTQIENIFNQYFHQSSQELQKSIIDLFRLLRQAAVLFGYRDLKELSVIQLLKENSDFQNNKIISYEELLNELLKSYQKIEKLENELNLLRNQSNNSQVIDSLTGVYNHTYFQEFLSQIISEAVRYEIPITLILIDIDQFRLFNNTYGYKVGNKVLTQLGMLVKKNLRSSDIVARFSDDEFAIVLSHAGIPQARFVGEKLCRLVSNFDFSGSESEQVYKITISAGAATIISSISLMQKEYLMQLAQKALSESRAQGGNCCTLNSE